jgi:hypothetical protein
VPAAGKPLFIAGKKHQLCRRRSQNASYKQEEKNEA